MSNIENKFEHNSTVYPSQIKFNLPAGDDVQKEIASGLGNLPFVWYNSYQIETNDIQFLTIYNNGIVPCIKMIFIDTLGLMKDKGFPLDDSRIKIFLNSRSVQLKPIFMEFKITSFKLLPNSYSITGTLNINKLYIKSFKSYSKMTSFKVLQEICRDIGLGFNSNLDDTNDEMTWINNGDITHEFIDEIVESSYKSDESFLLSYIDFYYNLNYVDLEKELSRNIQQEIGVSTTGIEEVAKLADKDKLSALFLTNDYSMSNSNCYFKSYKVINNSTSVSLENGYLNKIKFYNELDKDFLVFDIDSITSQGDKNIILKGSPQDETFYKENINLIYMGKIDTDNSHKNYNYSYVQNNKNITDLQKIGIEIEMGNPNYSLYRFQKINVFISNQASTPSQSHKNNRLSGDWLIVDILYKFSDGKLTQVIKLIKRELELSPEEIT